VILKIKNNIYEKNNFNVFLSEKYFFSLKQCQDIRESKFWCIMVERLLKYLYGDMLDDI
jgi:hypothetical protein